MGPRQMTGESSPRKKPMLISFSPKPSSGRIFLFGVVAGLPCTPVSSGIEGP